MSQDDQSQENPVPAKPRPWRGDELTLSGEPAPPKPPKDAGAPSDEDWDGAERTMPNQPADADAEDDDWVGDERTLPQRSILSDLPDDDWRGDERTMPDQATAGTDDAADWLGDERTIPNQAAAPVDSAADDWRGDDRTIPAGSAGTGHADADADWSGTDQTLIGAGADADQRRPTERKTLSDSRAGSGSGTGSRGSGSPHPSRATSATFDEAWHLDGRKGPFTGQVWGDWQIGGILGEGGMGAVYRGKQTSLKRRVAIKVLAPNLAQDPRLLQRFQLEARMTSMLSSPNLVQVFAAGEWEDNHFFVMEYVEGTDLYDVIRRRREESRLFTPDEAADVIIQAAKGLAEAGRYGMVHRDIKPSNLMVTSAGLVKVADFGIVKVLGESALTMTGQAVGTPSYVSPEQGRGQADIDQRSDIYSLGVVFYELLCDRKPFEATTPNALIYKHCYAEPELPREINAAISDEYQTVVLKCLQKKPENRYQSAVELITDLEAIHTGNAMRVALASGKLGTGAAEAQRENLSWMQRNLLPLVAGLVVLLLAGGAGGLWWSASDQERRARDADSRLRASELFNALSVLNDPRPVPEGAETLLEDYASLPGADTERIRVWRDKLDRIDHFHARLSRLSGETVSAAVRKESISDLESYTTLVGVDDPLAARSRERLTTLARREEALRERLAAFDQLPTLSQTQRNAAQIVLDELATLAGDDDAQVGRLSGRLADFDRRRDGYLQQLAVLDDPEATITETQAGDLQHALVAISAIIGSDDPRLRSWAAAITAKGERVGELRRRLARLDDFDLPPLTVQLELQRDLAAIQELIPATDPELRGWRARIAAATAEIASLRERLAVVDRTVPLPKAAWEQTDRLLTTLAGLVGESDADVIRWRAARNNLDRWVAERQATLTRIDDPAPFTFAERQGVDAARNELVAIGTVSDRQHLAIAARLAEEDAVTDALRERLAALDRIASITDQVRGELTAFRRRVDPADVDLLRWSTRVAAIDALRERLLILDTPTAIPPDVEQDLAALAELVGPQDGELLRWRRKIAEVAALRSRLAVLEQIASPPASAQRDLSRLGQLIGEDDGDRQRWQTRFTRIEHLRRSVGALLDTTAQDEDAVAASRRDLAQLAALIGDDEPTIMRLAARQAHLDGPGRPSWAAAHGRDRFGLWADLRIREIPLRLRYIPAGTFRMGSPGEDPQREADELQVEVHLSHAYWLADSEFTQAQWMALMSSNPSRDRGDERPVERVTWSEAVRACELLNEQVGSQCAARLPTEAEWERAARAGTHSWLQADDGTSTFNVVAWYAGNANGSSKEVRRRFPNPLGCYDLLGNVSEWTADRYGAYATGAVEDPLGAGGELRVARGGSWGDAAHVVRIANRIPVRPETRSAYLGFRIAITASGDHVRWFTDRIDGQIRMGVSTSVRREPTAPVDMDTPDLSEAFTPRPALDNERKADLPVAPRAEAPSDAAPVAKPPQPHSSYSNIHPRWTPPAAAPGPEPIPAPVAEPAPHRTDASADGEPSALEITTPIDPEPPVSEPAP